ncbi:hypothetical protein ACFRJ1_33085 [Streptomyces sp. NPDC056773]|uniref:hypothetical protein n=1 Tax=unclassified Streptomyces TaxID=2593676 RepID=UPI0036B82DE2
MPVEQRSAEAIPYYVPELKGDCLALTEASSEAELPRVGKLKGHLRVVTPLAGSPKGAAGLLDGLLQFDTLNLTEKVGVDICPPRRGNRKGVVEKANHSAAQRWWRTAQALSPSSRPSPGSTNCPSGWTTAAGCR